MATKALSFYSLSRRRERVGVRESKQRVWVRESVQPTFPFHRGFHGRQIQSYVLQRNGEMQSPLLLPPKPKIRGAQKFWERRHRV